MSSKGKEKSKKPVAKSPTAAKKPDAKPKEPAVKVSYQKFEGSLDIAPEDLTVILDSEIDVKQLAGHHLESFNQFTSIGINQIVTKLFQVELAMTNDRTQTAEDNEIDNIQAEVKFNRVEITRPTFVSYKSGKKNLLMPGLARRHNLNYSAPIQVDATITAKAFLKNSTEPRVRTEEVKNFRIASMPIMVRSRLCHTDGMTAEALKECEEDPRDPGGYFILKGQEWVVSNLETRLYNHPHVFRNVGHHKEVTRLEIISKPGDAYENSSELIMRYITTGNIFLTFTSNIYLKLLDIPFFVLFRLFGMTSDKEIIDNIVYGYSETGKTDVVSDHMLQILKTAFRTTDPVFGNAMYITDQAQLLRYFAKQTSILYTSGTISADAEIDENNLSYLTTNILRLLDKNVLPHIGLSHESRHKKLRYLGYLIHKLLLVEYEIVDSTDRDSFINKRVNPAGRGYAKAFKTQFNLAIVQQVKKKLRKQFKNMPFSQVPLAQSFKNSIYGPDLERALIQTIVSGNKEMTLKNKQISNRLASEMLNRKNQLNVLSTLRVIRTPNTSASKQDARADEMRRVHPSYLGYICPIQSADTGEQVGMVKQLALTSSIAPPGISQLLKHKLLTDPMIIPLDRVFPEDIHKNALTKIFVNGDWVGCCTNSPALFYKYRDLRRGYDIDAANLKSAHVEHGIDRYCTIHWDPNANEVSFWVDPGRLSRPLLVVRNNTNMDPIGQMIIGSKYDAKNNKNFVQDILLTSSDVQKLRQKKMDITHLHNEGMIDYISPEELENTYIASSLDELHANRYNSTRRYTHCEMPVAILGIPALTSPFTGHNPPVRTAFQTNQVKQTCGWYALNWPYRVDKHAFLQYYCEIPLVKTIANKYVYPNGSNAIVAIASYGGYNQEDSLLMTKSCADRGEYKGQHSNFIKTELDSHEKFGNPDEAHTMDIKKHADYSKIHEGFVKPGTRLSKDDIVIGKFYQFPKPDDTYFYQDKSISYPYDEEGTVDMVIRARNEEDNEFCKTKISSTRSLEIGSKFSSRAGQKGMTGMHFTQADMMFTESGMVPTLVVNPHAIPSRMTVNQPMECLVAKIDAIVGAVSDATVFNKVDLDAIGDLLEEEGFDRHGNERMFNGMTGEWIDATIFIGPTYYQRLQKFAVDEVYSISTGPTSVITRQPLTHFQGLKVYIKVYASKLCRHSLINKGIIVLPAYFATFSNCGNILRALTTACCKKLQYSTTGKLVGMVKTLKIGQSAAKDLHSINKKKIRVQRLQREWGFNVKFNVNALRYSLISCENMTCEVRAEQPQIASLKRSYNEYVKTLKRLTVEGKSNKGGLRIGEMEKDVIIGQGCGHFIMEKFRDDSDGFDIYVCRNCGNRPVVNEFHGMEICNTCRDDVDTVKIRSAWGSKLFFQELESMNVGVRLGVQPYEYQREM
jgi:Asfivirus DNA-directed RNA polymerase RPB2